MSTTVSRNRPTTQQVDPRSQVTPATTVDPKSQVTPATTVDPKSQVTPAQPASQATVSASRTVAANDAQALEVKRLVNAGSGTPWNASTAAKGLPADSPYRNEPVYRPATEEDRATVERLQRSLGLNPGNTPGVMGPTTKAFFTRAVEQKEQGEASLRDIENGTRTVGLGSTGETVGSIQTMLGAPEGARTRKAGPQTTAAVAEAQRRAGLKQTGEVDAETLKAIVTDYQQRNKLEPTGRLDDATLKALETANGQIPGLDVAPLPTNATHPPAKPLETYNSFLTKQGINVDLSKPDVQGRESMTGVLNAVEQGVQSGQLQGTTLDFIKSLTDPNSGINTRLSSTTEDNAYVPLLNQLGRLQNQAMNDMDGIRAGESMGLALKLLGQFKPTDPQMSQALMGYLEGLFNGART